MSKIEVETIQPGAFVSEFQTLSVRFSPLALCRPIVPEQSKKKQRVFAARCRNRNNIACLKDSNPRSQQYGRGWCNTSTGLAPGPPKPPPRPSGSRWPRQLRWRRPDASHSRDDASRHIPNPVARPAGDSRDGSPDGSRGDGERRDNGQDGEDESRRGDESRRLDDARRGDDRRHDGPEPLSEARAPRSAPRQLRNI